MTLIRTDYKNQIGTEFYKYNKLLEEGNLLFDFNLLQGVFLNFWEKKRKRNESEKMGNSLKLKIDFSQINAITQ